MNLPQSEIDDKTDQSTSSLQNHSSLEGQDMNQTDSSGNETDDLGLDHTHTHDLNLQDLHSNEGIQMMADEKSCKKDGLRKGKWTVSSNF